MKTTTALKLLFVVTMATSGSLVGLVFALNKRLKALESKD